MKGKDDSFSGNRGTEQHYSRMTRREIATHMQMDQIIIQLHQQPRNAECRLGVINVVPLLPPKAR
jgi:hypothetical protein